MEKCKSYDKYKTVFQPRCNCDACWTKFFKEHPAKCTAIDHVLRTRGDEVAINVLGEKYVKFYKRFKDQQRRSA